MSLHAGLGPTVDSVDSPGGWSDYPDVAECEVCGKRGPVTRHHVVYQQHVRNYKGDEWDPANSMLVGAKFGRCTCHARHHAGGEGRIPMSKVPESARQFAINLLGAAAAHYYFRRYYKEDR